MSLEDKIEKLTKAIEELTAIALSRNSDTPNSSAPSGEHIESPNPVAEQNDAPAITDLRDRVMAMVREDRTKKGAIKELIASYGGAKVIDEIPQKDLVGFAKRLGAL